MGVVAMPMRSDERIERLCKGAINLANYSTSKGLIPNEIVEQFKKADIEIQNSDSLIEILEKSSKRNSILPLKSNSKKELWNCLLGGMRRGFGIEGLDADKFKTELLKETKERFPKSSFERGENCSDTDRQEEILKQAKSYISNPEQGKGLHVTFSHWTDLALEMWGGETNDFNIKLMVIGQDAYNVEGMRNALLHSYSETVATWRNFWIRYFKNDDTSSSYHSLSQTKSNGVGNQLSKVEGKFTAWKLWPTNAVPYLRGEGMKSTGKLPNELKKDNLSIALLAYQIWLLQPEKIVVFGGGENGLANVITEEAIDLIDFKNSEKPQKIVVPHPSSSKIWACEALAEFIDN